MPPSTSTDDGVGTDPLRVFCEAFPALPDPIDLALDLCRASISNGAVACISFREEIENTNLSVPLCVCG